MPKTFAYPFFIFQKKKLIIYCLFLLSLDFTQVHAQETSDSLVLIKETLAKAKEHFISNRKLGETEALQVYELAKSNESHVSYFADVHNLLGLFRMYAGDFNAAESYILKGLKIAQQNNNKPVEMKLLGNIGLLYFKKGDYQKCLTVSLPMLETSTGVAKANLLGNIAASYNYLGQYDQSIRYQQEAINIFKEANNLQGLSTGYNLIGAVYNDKKKPAEALKFLHQGFEIKKTLNDTLGMANNLVNTGESYFLLGNYQISKDRFLEAEKLFKSQADKPGLARVYTNLGVLNSKLDSNAKAAQYEQQAIKIAEQIKDKYVLNEVYSNLGSTFKDQDQLDSALAYKEKALLIKDSFINLEVQKQVANMQVKYETAEKEKQILQQQYKLERKNIYLVASFALLALLSFSAYLLFANYKTRKKKELQQELFRQKQQASIEVINAEENERKRIAGDLHDGVGQLLTAANFNLQALEAFVVKDDLSQGLFQKTLALINESGVEVRGLSHNLMPNALVKKGLVNAVRDFISQIHDQKLKIFLETDGLNHALPTHIESVLYRIIQECVNNVIKHARATQLDISLLQDDTGINILIEDNGIGFSVAEVQQKDGIGLQNLSSRIQYLNGSIEWDTAPGKGTVVSIHVPPAENII